VTPRPLFVDGHSVIHAWPDLRALHPRQPRQAREELARRLRRFHDVGNWDVTLVFDGKAGAGEASRPGDLRVLYSKRDQTADSVIEALVAALPDRSLCAVITADGAERTTVEALGSYCYSPEWLELEMRSADAEFEEDYRRSRKRGGGW
jgi:hypothetical protein